MYKMSVLNMQKGSVAALTSVQNELKYN